MEVLTQDFVRRPLAMAFLAKRPAPTITAGFDVLVQLVMAAMTMLPSLSLNSLLLYLILTERMLSRSTSKVLGALTGTFPKVNSVPEPPSASQADSRLPFMG